MWWLRSPGRNDNFVAFVNPNGRVDSEGIMLSSGPILGVRPAFYLNLDAVLFTSTAEGGKSSGAEGAGSLAKVPDSVSTEYKLTLLDSSRNLQISGASAQTQLTPGKSITLNYTHAFFDSNNEYLSAMIVNETSRRPVYYGRVKQLVDINDVNGEVTISIPAADNFTGGQYTLYVFNEQYNGDKETDYSSALIPVGSMSVGYTVTYEPGANGNGTSFTAQKTSGQELTLAGASFTRDGYTQTGWSLTDGGEKAYDLGGSYTTDAPITLYPVWTQNTYAVTLNIRLDGVTYSGLTVALDASPNATSPSYALTEGNEGAYTHGAMPAGMYHVYVNGAYIGRQISSEHGGTWKIDYYTVSFDANGGAPAPQNQIVLAGNMATEPTGMTMPEHAFEGWYSGDQQWNFAAPVNQTLVLKANWSSISPETYELNVISGSSSGNYAAGVKVTIQADEAPAGMRFKQWEIVPAVTFVEGDVNTASAQIIMPESAVTATAQYEKIPAELTITDQPEDQFVVDGQSATFKIVATGDGVRYQWYINRGDGRGWCALDGAISIEYITSQTDLSCDGFQYACKVSDMHGNTLKSEVATLHVSAIPVIPETGDNSSPGLYLIMIILGCAGLMLLGRKRKYVR